jgi:hypothetical protein
LPLVGPSKFDRIDTMKTVPYYKYATTLFDVTRRSMPLPIPKTLTSDELYALCAYILALNNIIGEDEVMGANALPQVKMPKRQFHRMGSRHDRIRPDSLAGTRDALNRGWSGCIAGNGYPDAPVGPLVSYQINRQLSGWIRTFEAHCQGRKVPSDMIHPGWLGRGRLRRDRRRQMKTRAPVSPQDSRLCFKAEPVAGPPNKNYRRDPGFFL